MTVRATDRPPVDKDASAIALALVAQAPVQSAAEFAVWSGIGTSTAMCVWQISHVGLFLL